MAKHLLSNDHCCTQTVGAVSELAEAISAEMSVPGDRDPKPVWLWWSRIGAGRQTWTGGRILLPSRSTQHM
jgi:hypothetical protein